MCPLELIDYMREERSIFADPARSVGLGNAPVPGSVSPALFHGEN